MYEARKLNDQGIETFADHIALLRENPSFDEEFDFTKLFDDETSQPIDFSVQLDPKKSFGTLWDFAEYLDEEIGDVESLFAQENDGFFAWVAAFYFDQLRKEKPRIQSAYICDRQLDLLGMPSKSVMDVTYRHIVRGPLFLLRKPNIRRDLAERIFASSPIDEWGDLPENFCGRLDKPHLQIDVVQDFIFKNYFSKSGQLKKNSTTNGTAGNIRRLAKPVLPRLVNVLDVASLDSETLKTAWGKEFKDSEFS